MICQSSHGLNFQSLLNIINEERHHKGRNKHHYEYWTDNYDSGTTYIEIPEKYVRELVADWLAAGRTYNGKGFTIDDEIRWWQNCKNDKFIHPNTKKRITELMTMLK